MSARPPVVPVLGRAVLALEEEERALLAFLSPYTSGLGIAQLHAHAPKAVETADRLAAKGDLVRYPGCLFGVSDAGRKRLVATAARGRCEECGGSLPEHETGRFRLQCSRRCTNRKSDRRRNERLLASGLAVSSRDVRQARALGLPSTPSPAPSGS